MNCLDQLQGQISGERMGRREEALAGLLTLDCHKETYPAAGPVLWSDGEHMTVDDGEAHTLVVAGSGAGKTVSLVLPTLRACIKAGENLFVTDTKSSQLYRSAVPYLKQQGYRTWVVDLRHPDRGDRYNPLLLPLELLDHSDASMRTQGHELLWDLANCLTGNINQKDPFWDYAARDAFLGVAYLLRELGGKPIWNLYALREAYQDLCADNCLSKIISLKLISKDSPAYVPLCSRHNSSDSPKTASSIDSVFAVAMNHILCSPSQIHLLCGNDLDMWSLDQPKTAIFLLLPDETSACVTQASLLTRQVYRQLCLLADLRWEGRLPCRWNFLLEEFGNLDLGADAGRLFSAGRSRNIRAMAVVQDLSQLTARCGANEARTIRFNCENWVYLHSRDLDTLRELSELCGTRRLLSFGYLEPVASVSELQRIPMGQALVLHGRERPFITKLAPIWEYPETAPECEEEDHSHPMGAMPATFPLQRWVRSRTDRPAPSDEQSD